MTERAHEGVLGPGMTVGEFVIESVAGRGGMGVVYRARQREPDRVVALKVIAPELAGDPSFEARFKSEGRMAARIEHPNVIPVYAVGEEAGTLYIAMRFVVGTDLRAVIDHLILIVLMTRQSAPCNSRPQKSPTNRYEYGYRSRHNLTRAFLRAR